MKEVPINKFVGLWEIKGRSMFEGIHVRIEQQDQKLIGKIESLNHNKLIKMFAEVGDIWVADISRSSNFQFKLTERKIANDLFSLYGQSTSQDFKVEFIDDNTIGLGFGGADPQHSKILYKRIK